MTLDELIEELRLFKLANPEAGTMEVITEGCDCAGSIAEVKLLSNEILLTRP